jgi:hypothetical protein
MATATGAQSAQTGRLSVVSRQHQGGDARHHGAAGDGDTSAGAQDVLIL